jgi:PTH1 family peptidyl-tRNA hydrolase
MKSWWSLLSEHPNRILIVGLGNPGTDYVHTRHNIGFEVLRHIAQKHQFCLKIARKLKGYAAEGVIGGTPALLLLPTTYMNLSGESVIQGVRLYKFKPCKILIVADDIALPVGCIRLREKGGAGGHNGLKSIQNALQTQDYGRLRIGIGQPDREDLADYVLGRFTEEERLMLPKVINRATDMIELWIEQGIQAAMNAANIVPNY